MQPVAVNPELISQIEFKPVISVIMSVFNGVEFLAAAIESIRSQTVRDFEFIIIDDGSTDGSLALLTMCAGKDKRIRLISRENRGLIASLNEAAALAKAPLLARMDCDDIAHPARFELQLRSFEARQNLVALGAQTHVIGKDGLSLGKIHRYPIGKSEFKLNYPLGGPFVAHPLLMMRAEAFRKVGGYRAPFVAAEDLDLVYRLLEIGEVDNLSDTLLDYRFHGKNVSIVGGYKQMLARATLIELVLEKERSGIDYLVRLEGPIDLNTIETQINYLGFRNRLIARLVDYDYAYNSHAMTSIVGFDAFAERIVQLSTVTTADDAAAAKLKRGLIWTATKTFVRTGYIAALLPMLKLSIQSSRHF